jgi:hypothetical protein
MFKCVRSTILEMNTHWTVREKYVLEEFTLYTRNSYVMCVVPCTRKLCIVIFKIIHVPCSKLVHIIYSNHRTTIKLQ